MEIKKHWFLFVFTGNGEDGQIWANAQTGYLQRDITQSMISENKKYAGVSENAVLINIVYLGFMDKKTFLKKN